MPYVTISTVRGIFDVAQKQALLQRVTDLMVEVEGQGNPDFRRNVWVARRHDPDTRHDRGQFRGA